MTRRLLIGTLAMMAVALLPGMAPAQDVTAEVRTWAGQSWMLAQPSLEVFYTIVPPKPEGSGPGAAGGGLYGSGESQTGTSAAAGPFSGVSLFGSQESVRAARGTRATPAARDALRASRRRRRCAGVGCRA